MRGLTRHSHAGSYGEVFKGEFNGSIVAIKRFALRTDVMQTILKEVEVLRSEREWGGEGVGERVDERRLRAASYGRRASYNEGYRGTTLV